MSLVVSIAGTDISTQSIQVGGVIDSWQSSPVITRAVTGIAGRYRNYLSRTTMTGPRVFTLPIFGYTATLSDRVAALDYVKGYLDQEITLRMADGTTTREIIGTVTSVPANSIVTTNNPQWKGQMVMLCGDPLWRATADTTSGSITTVTTIPLGTGPTEDWIFATTVAGGSDARTITYTIGGTTNYVCTWTGTIGGNTLTVNAGTGTVLNNATNARSGWVGGFPSFHPNNGTCTLTMTCSSGTATTVVTHRKRYY